MKHLLVITALAVALTAAAVSERYASLAVRADRSYEWREWRSALAIYELMLDERPDSAAVYARAIVAAGMAGDTAAGPDLVERAMSHGIGFASLLGDVRRASYAVGAGDSYGDFLLRLRHEMPWMRRPLDNELLEYYTFRRDGLHMVEYARIMLDGLPDSPRYLAVLAEGYLLDGDDSAAVATWRHILELDPEAYDTLLNLGYYLAVHDDREGALELLRRARALRPTPYVAATIDRLTRSR